MDFMLVNYIVACSCIVISCFGCVGNLAILFAFQKEKHKTSTTFILQALALSDTTLLISYIPFYYVLFNNGDINSLYLAHGKRNICLTFANFTSIWITILVATNR